ncbi:MAG: flagellar biosynthetic protein FliR [Flavobacteriaceae bacterium]
MTITLLPDIAFAFMLIFARLGSMIMLMPAVGDRAVPVRIRLVFALAMTLVFYPLIQPTLPAVPQNLPAMATVFGSELIVGLFIGIAIRMILVALTVAGTTIAFQMGLGFANGIDPTQEGGQGAVIGTFLSLLGLTLILATDLHHVFIAALGDSYRMIPAGTLFSAGDMARTAMMMFADAFRLGIQMSAPFIAFGLLFYLGLGILSRLMPQLQVFFIAMPLNITLGFIMLAILIVSLMGWYLDHVGQAIAPFVAG